MFEDKIQGSCIPILFHRFVYIQKNFGSVRGYNGEEAHC